MDSHTAPITSAPWACKGCIYRFLHVQHFSRIIQRPGCSGQSIPVYVSFSRCFPMGTRCPSSEGLPSATHATGTGTVCTSSCRGMARRMSVLLSFLLQHLQWLPIPEDGCAGNLLTRWKWVTSDSAEPSSPWRSLQRLGSPAACKSSTCREQDKPPALLPAARSQQCWHRAGRGCSIPGQHQPMGMAQAARPCASLESTEPAQRLPQALQHPAVPEPSLPEQQQR